MVTFDRGARMERELTDWPIITSSGLTLPSDVTDPESGGPLTITISIDEAAERRVSDVMQMVRDEIARYPSDNAVRAIARIAREFEVFVPQMVELADFLDRLQAEGNWSAIARILGDGSRGRRFESPFFLVGLVDRVREQFGWPTSAAQWIAENYGSRFCKSARAIENDYSRYKALYDCRYGAWYVRPGRVLATRATRPCR